MRAIERVTAHYGRNRSSVILVPEWSESKDPFKVFFDPITPKERKRILAENGGAFDSEAHVDTLILKAKDETGAPLFTEDDRDGLLTRACSGIIARIALEMLLPVDRKQLEKN